MIDVLDFGEDTQKIQNICAYFSDILDLKESKIIVAQVSDANFEGYAKIHAYDEYHIYISSDTEDLIYTLAHEFIHVHQYSNDMLFWAPHRPDNIVPHWNGDPWFGDSEPWEEVACYMGRWLADKWEKLNEKN